MKCWIKRYNDKKEFVAYFSKHLGFDICPNCWVQQRTEAKQFFDGRKARGIINKYKLRNCEIEYEL